VPGLLQTADYARAVTLLGHPGVPAGQIEQRVRLRLTRQQLLSGPDPLRCGRWWTGQRCGGRHSAGPR
jgi:hypothetical protein